VIKPCFYEPHLLEGEKVLYRTQKHTVTRAYNHILFFITAIGTTSVLGYFFTEQFQVLYTSVALVIFQLLLFGIHLWIWRILLVRRGLVFTDRRIILFESYFFSGTISSIVYDQIAEFTLQQSVLGKWLGFGSIWVRLSDQNKEIDFMDYEYAATIERILNERVLMPQTGTVKKTP